MGKAEKHCCGKSLFGSASLMRNIDGFQRRRDVLQILTVRIQQAHNVMQSMIWCVILNGSKNSNTIENNAFSTHRLPYSPRRLIKRFRRPYDIMNVWLPRDGHSLQLWLLRRKAPEQGMRLVLFEKRRTLRVRHGAPKPQLHQTDQASSSRDPSQYPHPIHLRRNDTM